MASYKTKGTRGFPACNPVQLEKDMHWKFYQESSGKPSTHEVIIRFDERDISHPFFRSRCALYDGLRKKVVLVPSTAVRCSHCGGMNWWRPT